MSESRSRDCLTEPTEPSRTPSLAHSPHHSKPEETIASNQQNPSVFLGRHPEGTQQEPWFREEKMISEVGNEVWW